MRSYRTKINIGDILSTMTYLGYSPTTSDRQRGVFMCSCGVELTAHLSEVKRGRSTSCGCKGREATRKRSTTHGHARHGQVSSEYKSWRCMRKRCLDPSHEEYHRYGGRGLSIEPTWVLDFQSFINDMGLKPSRKHTLERLNNDLGYFKENCMWATMKEQANNRSNNVFVLFKGEKKTISQWATLYNIDSHALRSRVSKGWDIERALTTPLNTKNSHRKINNI